MYCTKPHVNSAYQHVIALTTKTSNMARLFWLVFFRLINVFFPSENRYILIFLGFEAPKSGRLACTGMLLRG